VAGFWFGNLPAVKNNLSLVIVAIIGLSLLPIAIGWLRQRLAR
jgi:membrane-associated protein